MLTIRPFRNEDPPRLLTLWQKTRCSKDDHFPMVSLSSNQLQMQVLGLPMLDTRAIMLAFDEENTPIGYIHTAFAPTADGYALDYTTGQICFLCVDPLSHDAFEAAVALIRAAEGYLFGQGAQKIFGGSPSPSTPFYTGFYSGGEAVGILHSDRVVINAFHVENYQIYQKTAWFHLDLRDYVPKVTVETVGYDTELQVEIHEIPEAQTWWEGCTHTNGIWFDATAYLIRTQRPIARLRTRITYPDTENVLMMYGGTWVASLMDIRVHPNFADSGVNMYLLGELIRYLMTQNQVVQVEAHVAESSPLFTLLHNQGWLERDSGSIFVKE